MVLWTAACGDGGTGPAPAPNRAPLASGSITPQTVAAGQTVTINVASYFTDPDGDALTFTAASSNAATASVSVSGSVVTVTAAARGIATVTVTARDPGGMSAQLTFTVTVPNQAPVAVDAVPAQSIFVGDTASVDASAYFNDPDGDALSYSVANSDATAVSASVAGSVVSLTAITQGISTVTVTASDPDGLSAEQDIAVTVPNRAPTALDTIPSRTLLAGNTLEFDLARYFTDPDGDSLTFTAASANVGVASVESAGSTLTISARAPGSTRVTVTVADPAGMAIQQLFAVTVPNREPVAIGSIPGRSVEPRQVVTVDVSPFFDDPDGEVLSYSAASSNRGVATAAVAGATITLTGVSVGTASIAVTATDPGGLTAQQRFSVTVRAANDAPEVVSTIPDLSLTVDEVRAWRGANHFRDPNGDPLTYAAGSSNAAVVLALVSGAEFGVGAVSVGSAVVTVTASDPGGLSAQFSFRVTVQPGTQTEVVISGVAPAVLVEGAEARITGSGFSATAAQNQVSVGGRSARVTSASATSLSFIVPRSDCLPPRREELRVVVGSKSDARAVGVTPQSLEVEPNHYWYTYGGNGCLHLPGSASRGEYLIGVTSISEDAASLTDVNLAGTPWDASVVAAESDRIVVAAHGKALEEASQPGMAALAQGPFSASAAFAPQPALPMAPAPAGGGIGESPLADDTLRMRWTRAHNEIMARNEELLRRLERSGRTALADARSELQVGDTLTLYADAERTTCYSSAQVRAVVRHVGNRSIWLDDLDNPTETFSDSELANLDAFYSTNIKGVHDDYFGGLSDVDSNRRFLVLMTKEANRADLGGWVWPLDLLPRQDCPTSNQAEIFYGHVPDPKGVVGNMVTKQALLDYYPSLVAHEVTHLVQAYARFQGAGGQRTKDLWEWEGGATLAEQLVAYGIFGHGSGRELGWAAYNYSAESRDWYWDWLGDMAHFFGWDHRGSGTGRIALAPEECSWVGRADDGNSGPCLLDGREIYGVPSMVLRYAMDRWGGDYPGGERALMRRLTQSPHRGFASLVDVSPERSWRPEQILADFYITLWIDLQGWQAYGMTTWDLHDIFTNMRESLRLRPYTSSSPNPRLTSRRVRAGSSLYFHWTPAGALSPTSIKVTSLGGGRLPNHISVWALRVR
ncbi:MAG: Ig-like domain-containing protein [Gammaproteobacteria bacterium]|nr:Ig-like domain-containing protein [Gammaproteobacteria bacterium]